MKRIAYNISVLNPKTKEVELKKVIGYLYVTKDNYYGVDHRFKYGWVVTELRTGRQVLNIIPKLKDVYSRITPDIDEQVSRVVKNLSKTTYANLVDAY